MKVAHASVNLRIGRRESRNFVHFELTVRISHGHSTSIPVQELPPDRVVDGRFHQIACVYVSDVIPQLIITASRRVDRRPPLGEKSQRPRLSKDEDRCRLSIFLDELEKLQTLRIS